MELQQLRYVIALARERNFTRAAARCSVGQSALSHQIKALERELGVALFARTSRRVELTSAGEAFLPAARASIEASERAAVEAAATIGTVSGTLTVGLIPTVTAIDVPALLNAFHRSHPSVRINVRAGGSDEFITAISEGIMDIAVLGLPDPPPPEVVSTRVLAREELVAVFSADHALARRPSLHLADLAEESFVDFPDGTPGRTPSDMAFEAVGISREVIFESMDIDLTLDLVRQNLAITLLPPATLPAGSQLMTVPLVDAPRRTEYLAWNSFNLSPAARAFLEGLA